MVDFAKPIVWSFSPPTDVAAVAADAAVFSVAVASPSVAPPDRSIADAASASCRMEAAAFALEVFVCSRATMTLSSFVGVCPPIFSSSAFMPAA